MNRRVGILFVGLILGGIFVVLDAKSHPAPQATRKAINLPGKTIAAPFSDAILSGNTLYLAGRIGLDKDGKAPEKIEDEIKLLLDSEKDVLAQAGFRVASASNGFSGVRLARREPLALVVLDLDTLLAEVSRSRRRAVEAAVHCDSCHTSSEAERRLTSAARITRRSLRE